MIKSDLFPFVVILAAWVGFEPVARAVEPAKKAKTITPDLDRIVLDVGGRKIKPIKVSPFSSVAERSAAGLRLRVEDGTVRAFKDKADRPAWTAEAPGKQQLHWLDADERVAYFLGYTVDKESEEAKPDSRPSVRRLDLASGQWLDDFAVGSKIGANQTESVRAALAADGRVAVLTAVEDGAGPRGGELVSYRVTCFKAGETKSLWSESFQSAGKMRSPGAFLLWAARSPDKVEPDVRPLTRLGGDFLVCAGPVQDLVCLAGETGKPLWRVPRVWDFERGFIGPSVWQHFFGRRGSGDDRGAKKADNAKGDKEGAKREPAQVGSIVGGPVVVERTERGATLPSRHVFVAVASGPAQYAEYLSDCVVYELNDDGEPLAMVTLPRMVLGGRFQAQPDGAVWACRAGGIVKLGLSRHRRIGIGMGPGGPDLLARVLWYRQPEPPETAAWLTSDPAGDLFAFGKGVAYRVIAGGYVKDRGEGVYRFPLTEFDLTNGTDRNLVLDVPYKGEIPVPETNFTSLSSRDGKEAYQTFGPYLMGVTRLQADNGRLRVTLGMVSWARDLDFDLADLRARQQP